MSWLNLITLRPSTVLKSINQNSTTYFYSSYIIDTGDTPLLREKVTRSKKVNSKIKYDENSPI